MTKVQDVLAVSLLGPNNNGAVKKFIDAISARKCTIVDCRSHPLGNALASSFLLSGNWSVLGRLESALPALAAELGFEIILSRTEASSPLPDFRPYAAEIIVPQEHRVLAQIYGYFDSQGIEISEMGAHSYQSTHTDAAMCSIQMVLHVPLSQRPPALRESFMDFCDEICADGMLDPIKS